MDALTTAIKKEVISRLLRSKADRGKDKQTKHYEIA